MEILGIDIGFGFTKGANGKEFVLFKSILGEAADIQYRSDFGAGVFTENLHVTIDNRSYFIGDLAEQQSNVRQFTLDQETLITDFVKTLAITVIGSFADRNEPINVVSGLPVGYYRQDHKRFSRILAGHHTITYHKPDGNQINRKVFVNKVRMMPQPLGSFFNVMINNRGKINNLEMTKQKVGIVDIGFRTTDFTIFDRLRYIERGSATIDYGMSKSFGVIAAYLREKSGVNVELFRLYPAVEKGTIKIRGQEYNFTRIRDEVFARAAATIANEVNRLWGDDWDIDAILLTGGGSAHLAQHLAPRITGHVIPPEPSTDPRMNNVQGYLNYGRYIWAESGGETPPGSEKETT